jgi:hypothetical protein
MGAFFLRLHSVCISVWPLLDMHCCAVAEDIPPRTSKFATSNGARNWFGFDAELLTMRFLPPVVLVNCVRFEKKFLWEGAVCGVWVDVEFRKLVKTPTPLLRRVAFV